MPFFVSVENLAKFIIDTYKRNYDPLCFDNLKEHTMYKNL